FSSIRWAVIVGQRLGISCVSCFSWSPSRFLGFRKLGIVLVLVLVLEIAAPLTALSPTPVSLRVHRAPLVSG
ncbi:MAG: hypothetical protein ACKV19_00785, partial [Verrucomicrobiales bacterium]